MDFYDIAAIEAKKPKWEKLVIDATRTGDPVLIERARQGLKDVEDWVIYAKKRNAYYKSLKGIPKRSISRKTRSKSKTRSLHAEKVSKVRGDKGVKRKVRSQHAKTKVSKVVKRKGVKNYLSRVISNVSDSVKNTGKAVLSPLRMKKTKKVKKQV
jgi:hypothetical protein